MEFFEHYSVSCTPCPMIHECVGVDLGGGGGASIYIYIYIYMYARVFVRLCALCVRLRLHMCVCVYIHAAVFRRVDAAVRGLPKA